MKEKQDTWKKILEEFREPPPSTWTANDEHELEELKKMDFKWADTAAGRLEQTKKMELHAAVGKMDRQERDELRRKLELADEDENENAAT